MLLTKLMPITFWTILWLIEKCFQLIFCCNLMKLIIHVASNDFTHLIQLFLHSMKSRFQYRLSIMYVIQFQVGIELIRRSSICALALGVFSSGGATPAHDRMADIPLIEFFKNLFCSGASLEAIFILLLRRLLIINHPFLMVQPNIRIKFLQHLSPPQHLRLPFLFYNQRLEMLRQFILLILRIIWIHRWTLRNRHRRPLFRLAS